MHRFSTALLAFTLLIPVFAQTPPQATPQPAPARPAPLPPPRVKIDPYRERAARIIGAALTSDVAYRRLALLTDRFGHRLSGSESLERAIAWALAEMRRDGLEGVRAEKVMVPHWVRGEESLELVNPPARKLSLLGLGGSVGTPPAGVEAEAVVVRSFDELDALGEGARGKIVVYNVPFTTYGATVQYRGAGASRAARHGAVAALVRSVTPVSLQTPHTGALRYTEGQPQIPAAAVTIEGAELLQRMYDRGDRPRLRLKMGARLLPDAESANVVAEIKGAERPEEVVIVSGHFDSWDVGQGAHDDGGGCIAAWEAVRLLKVLGLKPRRTVRAVLYTNEENGLRGGNAYRDQHRAELANHVLAIESDSGVYRPTGFGLDDAAPPQVRADIREIARLLAGIRADRIDPDGGGADIGPIMREGVTGMSLNVDGTHYFDIHHTEADTRHPLLIFLEPIHALTRSKGVRRRTRGHGNRAPMTPPNTTSDAELLRLTLAGDESAFTALFRRRQAGVYRFALHMSGSEALAEDVVQEAFIVLIRDGRNFDPARGSVAAYLYGIARNHVLRAFERERALVPLAAEADGEGEPLPDLVSAEDPLGDLTRGEMIEKLRTAVLALPAHYREVVALCELQELSYAEAAAALDCAVGTVRSRLHRARAMLASKLRERRTLEERVGAGGVEAPEGEPPQNFRTARCFA